MQVYTTVQPFGIFRLAPQISEKLKHRPNFSGHIFVTPFKVKCTIKGLYGCHAKIYCNLVNVDIRYPFVKVTH